MEWIDVFMHQIIAPINFDDDTRRYMASLGASGQSHILYILIMLHYEKYVPLHLALVKVVLYNHGSWQKCP